MMRFSVAFLALLSVSFGPSATEANSCTSTSTDDILSLACDSANVDFFGDLCSALQDTGIDGSIPALNGDYTVFAPLNSAFDAAGRRIGVTNAQKQATLQYHIVSGEFNSPGCGDELDTLLFWQGQRQTVTFRCTSGTVDSVEGDVTLPFAGSPDPLIRDVGTATSGTPPRIDACNGVIYPITNVLGFGPIQYDWNFQPCAFNEPNCVRPIYAKGGKGGVVVAQQNIGGLNFVSYTKKSKNWNFRPYQSFYTNNAYFGPYWNGYGGGYGGGWNYPYYGGYGHKQAKKGYGYGYGYGYGAKGYGNNFWWRKNRRKLGEDEDMMEGGKPSAYEPMEYYESEDAAVAYEEPASTAGDYYYNYRKNRNLRRGVEEQ